MRRNKTIRGDAYPGAQSDLAAGSYRCRPFARAAATALILAWAVSAAGAKVEPFSDSAALEHVNGDERRVWTQGNEIALAIDRGGIIYENPGASAYVQSVMDRLFPEFKGSVQVAIVKSSQLNAFALPNGRIYINQGLLARLRNEAQLATLLGHEGTHFTYRHGYQSERKVKNAGAFATFGSMILPGAVGFLPQLLAISSVYGFSREMETEADVQGFARLQRAGYDVHESPRIFEHLMADIKAEDIKEPFFFATHPKLADRVQNMKKLSAGAPYGGDGTSDLEYANRMAQLRLDSLEHMLSMGRAKSALVMLSDPERVPEFPPEAQYYLGEAYRLRGHEGDARLAEEAYLKAIEVAPAFPPSYRGLGVLRFKANHYTDAQNYLDRYLELAPDAPDRKYVDSYLSIARKKAGSQP